MGSALIHVHVIFGFKKETKGLLWVNWTQYWCSKVRELVWHYQNLLVHCTSLQLYLIPFNRYHHVSTLILQIDESSLWLSLCRVFESDMSYTWLNKRYLGIININHAWTIRLQGFMVIIIYISKSNSKLLFRKASIVLIIRVCCADKKIPRVLCLRHVNFFTLPILWFSSVHW